LDKTIYKLTVEDVQNVAEDVLNRELTTSEIVKIEEKIAEKIDWYNSIYYAIVENINK